MADILASVSVVLGAEVSTFKAAMAEARKELKGVVQAGEALQNVGGNLTKAVSAPLALLATGAVAASAKLESLKSGLQAIAQQELGKQGITGLVGIQQAAQQTGERIKLLQDIAKQPGLGFETAEQADIRLRAVGISADQSAKSIKAFANAIATTGGGTAEFGTVTTQLSQLGAKGKVLAQDLRPIIEAAPAVAAALQTLYGTVDSEEISKSLAKQGQSSKDFIRILTDELAKLPQVTGGLKAVYENDMDALLVASAKVGDGIAKAFNLQAVGERLGDQITAIGDGFANLSEPTQTAVVALGGVVAATGPVLLGLGTLGVALPNIKAGFVAAQSGARLLSTSLVALLSPTTLVVAGVAALAAGAYYLATANERTLDSYREQSAATRKLTTDVAPLLDRYDELRTKTSLNAAEQAELKAIVEKVTAVMPAAGQGIDGYGNYIGLATEKARDFIKGNQGLEKAIALQSLPAQRQKLLDLSEAYDRLLDERDQLNRGAFNGVKVEDLGTRFLVDFQKELGNTATELEKQRRLVAELGSAAGVTAQQYDALGATFPTLAANLAKLGTAFPIPNFAGNAVEITAHVGLLKGLHEQLKQLKEDQQNVGTEAAALSFNPQIKGLQEYISRLEGADKTSKKATDAIKKLHEELVRLTALDKVLGNAPDELQVLVRRADTLEKGLKTLVDNGVSTSSRAFKGFAQDLVATSQAADRLMAGISKNMPDGEQLELKPVEVKSLIPRTIGDTLPQDVARLLGDYAKQVKPFELPIAAKLNMQAISEAMQPVQLLNRELLRLAGIDVKPDWDGFVPKTLNTELLKIGTSYQQIRAASDLFGDSLQGFDEAGARANQLRESMMNLVQAGFAPTSQYLQDFKQQYQEASAASLQFARDVQASSIVQQGAVDVVSGLGQALGNALSGTAGFSDSLVKTVLSGVGEVAVQLGKILVASGLGIEALKVSLKTFSGVGAVVAGLGLIAIGTFASSAAASIGNNAGRSAPAISSSAASSPRNNFTPSAAPAAAQASAVYTHKVEIVASGANLAGVLTLNTDRLGRVVGRR